MKSLPKLCQNYYTDQPQLEIHLKEHQTWVKNPLNLIFGYCLLRFRTFSSLFSTYFCVFGFLEPPCTFLGGCRNHLGSLGGLPRPTKPCRDQLGTCRDRRQACRDHHTMWFRQGPNGLGMTLSGVFGPFRATLILGLFCFGDSFPSVFAILSRF